MLKTINIVATLAGFFLVTVTPVLCAQEEWPHSSVDWSDPLFQARVQGVYDWIGSGPDRLMTNEFTEVAIPYYQLGTINRDLESFPPRARIDPDAESFFEPKDWMDRRFLIQYMENNSEIEPGYFESNLTDSAIADTYYLMANIYFLQGRFEEAIAHYEIAIEQFPFFKLAYKNNAYALAISDDCVAALENATQAVSLGAANIGIKNVQAFCAFETGDFSLAVDASAMSRVLDSGNLTILKIQIHSHKELGHYEQALALSSQLPDSSERIGIALEIQLAASEHRNNEEDQLALLEIKSRMGGLSEAEESSLTRLKLLTGSGQLLDESSLEGYFQLESANATEVESFLLSRLDTGQAVPFDLLTTLRSNSASARELASEPGDDIDALLALIAMQAGNIDEAEKILDRALQQRPMQCELLLLRSELNQVQGDTLAQQSFMERAIASSRACDNNSLEQRALMSVANGEYPEAQNLILRDWNQKIARGEIPDELYVRKFRAITNLGNLTSE